MEDYAVHALADLTALPSRDDPLLSIKLMSLDSLREIPAAHEVLIRTLQVRTGWMCPRQDKLWGLFGVVVELTRMEADLLPRVSNDPEDTEALLLLGNAADTVVRRTGNTAAITKHMKNKILCMAKEIQETTKELQDPPEGATEERIRRRLDALLPGVTRLLDDVPVSFADAAVAPAHGGAAAVAGGRGGAAAVAVGEPGADVVMH